MLIVAAVMWVVFHHTVFGRHLFAVGKNEEAERYSGIRTHRVIIAAYVICSVLTAIAAVFFAMYTRSISPSSHGNFYELFAIAAAVLGGFSLRGGEGSIIGVVLGVILLQVLQNLVNLLGIPSSLNFAVSGSVILIGVLADQEYADFRERRERLRRLAAGAGQRQTALMSRRAHHRRRSGCIALRRLRRTHQLKELGTVAVRIVAARCRGDPQHVVIAELAGVLSAT
jgi:ribose transport system permease protein